MQDDLPRIQTSLFTFPMREVPTLLAIAALRGRFRPLRILSFGCSVGDELAALRTVFPNATLHGCDVDPLALARAEASMAGIAEVFASGRAAIIARGPFDVICGFSSLCRHPQVRPEVMRASFPFSIFEDVTGMLVEALAPGGVLAVINPSYLLRDTAHGGALRPVRRLDAPCPHIVPVWNPDGTMAMPYVMAHTAPIPVAKATGRRDDWDFIDSLFIRQPGPPITLEERLAPLPPVPSATWSRSNFDYLPGEPPAGAIEIRHDFALWQEGERGPTRVTCTARRDRLGGGPPLIFGPREVSGLRGRLARQRGAPSN